MVQDIGSAIFHLVALNQWINVDFIEATVKELQHQQEQEGIPEHLKIKLINDVKAEIITPSAEEQVVILSTAFDGAKHIDTFGYPLSVETTLGKDSTFSSSISITSTLKANGVAHDYPAPRIVFVTTDFPKEALANLTSTIERELNNNLQVFLNKNQPINLNDISI